MADSITKVFTKGLWKEVAPLRFALGICPALAVSTNVESALGMGMAVLFVLLLSNGLVSAIRNVVPDKVRIAVFISIIATGVVIVELVMQAYFYPLFLVLGIWIPLIVVNCLVLGRAEAFARKNPVHLSIADAVGMGLGFTMSLVVISSIREVLGNGTWLGLAVMPESYPGFDYLLMPAGAFLVFGLVLAGMNLISSKIEKNKVQRVG
ncbi:MAG: electron transport complex subunit E [Desulfonatronovibrio sp. MSAO_Bac4]|nr:MAG: electron transport complex subunit E [Desulfonatronovibrio sp. MSAO_Bac4]